MRILLTNDDGIFAGGLRALYRVFSKSHDVTVVAPDRERSAIGHAITLHQPLRTQWIETGKGYGGYAVNGTPADCVKIAILQIMDRRPDMVVSGINPGVNVGVNINYSGTVAAAKEASLYGINAIAVSIQKAGDDSRYAEVADCMERFSRKVADKGLPFGSFLNVNFPDGPVNEAAGVRVCPQGIEPFKESMEKRIDPRNRPYYWQGCDAQTFTRNPEADGSAVAGNYIAITPMKCDTTDYDLMNELETMIS